MILTRQHNKKDKTVTDKKDKKPKLNYGLSDNELIIIHEMILGGAFSGKGIEDVVSLKEKIENELKNRGLIKS